VKRQVPFDRRLHYQTTIARSESRESQGVRFGFAVAPKTGRFLAKEALNRGKSRQFFQAFALIILNLTDGAKRVLSRNLTFLNL
jgi:hypothetical protein